MEKMNIRIRNYRQEEEGDIIAMTIDSIAIDEWNGGGLVYLNKDEAEILINELQIALLSLNIKELEEIYG